MGLTSVISRLRIFLLLALFAAGITTSLSAAPTEFELKLAFIYNFAQYVQWPNTAFASPEAPLVVAVSDPESLTKVRRVLEGQKIENHPIKVRLFDADLQFNGVQIVFVQPNAANRASQVISHTRGRPILTVGDCPDFASEGGIIRFVKRDDRLRFEINRGAAAHNHLEISSRLLRLGILVHTESGNFSDSQTRHPLSHRFSSNTQSRRAAKKKTS